jgi:peroxiredoxin
MTEQPSLHEQIESEIGVHTPPAIQEMIDRMVEGLRRDGVTPGIAVGDVAPSFDLPDPRGQTVRLADRLAAGPVVLSFYRGAWCPICSLELRALTAILPQVRDANASLIAISPQGPDASLALVESLDLGFDVLSDLDQSVASEYRIKFELSAELQALYEQFDMSLTKANADGTWDLPVPATFVLDRTGVVRAAHVDADYRERMEPTDILAALERIEP